MQFTGWMMDIARDQSPCEEWLIETCSQSRAAGYGVLGLYLEHRFAYPSAPWAAADGALTPEVAKRVVARFQKDGLRIIPFLNTLGHMEGFIRSAGGEWLAEGPLGWSLQMCPTRPECVSFARGLVDDALAVFDDEWVHIGGDETRLLGHCPLCAERLKTLGKHGMYGAYFGELCRWVLERGRRPCIWGDMLLHHSDAMPLIPRETIIFDWQYFNRPRESVARFRTAGFDVICCPSVQSYNAGWCFLNASQQNIDEHAEDARALGALGVLVTSWEFTYFSSYASVMPLIFAAGRRMARGESWSDAIRQTGGPGYAEAAEILGNAIPAAAAAIAPGTWRLLRDRLVIKQSPFELWRAWRIEACGPAGDAILRHCDRALEIVVASADARAETLLLPLKLHRVAVLLVREIESAANCYARGDHAACIARLHAAAAITSSLTPYLRQVADAGGSRADLHRLDRIAGKYAVAIERIDEISSGATWRPSFEALTRDMYIASDQANWLTGETPPYKPD